MACLVKTIKLDFAKITSDKLLFLKCYIMFSQGGVYLDPKVPIDIPMSELCRHVPIASDFIYYHNGEYSSSFILSTPQFYMNKFYNLNDSCSFTLFPGDKK